MSLKTKIFVSLYIFKNKKKLITVSILGATDGFQKYKKTAYIVLFVLCLLISIFLAIPATHYSGVFMRHSNIGEINIYCAESYWGYVLGMGYFNIQI